MSPAWSCTVASTSPTCRTRASIKFLGDEDATVAHVTIIKEEVVAEAAVAAAPAEPEVAKKGKTDA